VVGLCSAARIRT